MAADTPLLPSGLHIMPNITDGKTPRSRSQTRWYFIATRSYFQMGPSAAPGRLLQVASPTPLACPHPRPCLMGPWCICLAHIYPSLYPSSLHTSPPDIDPQRRWFYYLPYFFQNSPLNQRFIDHKYATIPLNIRPFAPLESAILFLVHMPSAYIPLTIPLFPAH